MRNRSSPATGRCSRRCRRPSSTSRSCARWSDVARRRDRGRAALHRGRTRRPKPRAARNIAIAAQNLHWEREGAFTGEVSAEMIREAGARVCRSSVIPSGARCSAKPISRSIASSRAALVARSDSDCLHRRVARAARRESDAGRARSAGARRARQLHRGAACRAGHRLRAGVGDRHRAQRDAGTGAGGACAHPRAAQAVVWRRRRRPLPHPLRRQRQARQHRRADRRSRTSTARSSAAPASTSARLPTSSAKAGFDILTSCSERPRGSRSCSITCLWHLRPRLFSVDCGDPAAAGQRRRHRECVWRRQQPSGLRRARGRDTADKMTTGLAAAFILLSLTLAVWGQRGPGSVVGGIGAPAPAAAPAAPATPPGNATPPRQHPAPYAAPGPRASALTTATATTPHRGHPTRELPKRKWRNWQTHQLEGLAIARAWGFESPLPHQL